MEKEFFLFLFLSLNKRGLFMMENITNKGVNLNKVGILHCILLMGVLVGFLTIENEERGPYDWMYGKASFLWHGSFLQIISVLGGLQKWLSYENHSQNFAERSIKKNIDFFSVKLPKTVRERKKNRKKQPKILPPFLLA